LKSNDKYSHSLIHEIATYVIKKFLMTTFFWNSVFNRFAIIKKWSLANSATFECILRKFDQILISFTKQIRFIFAFIKRLIPRAIWFKNEIILGSIIWLEKSDILIRVNVISITLRKTWACFWAHPLINVILCWFIEQFKLFK